MNSRLLVPPCLLILGCIDTGPRTLPPAGQLLVYVDTDAPLPAPPGETLGPEESTPLFDRVRIEVFRPGESNPCPGCAHEFDLDRALVAAGRASVGITTTPHVEGHRARVRLFRASFSSGATPREDTTVDVTVSLPATAEEGIVSVTVPLRVEDVARPRGTLDAPIAPSIGAPAPMGMWAVAKRVPCNRAAKPGEVCIPGSAFWMGNPQMQHFQGPGDAVVMRIAVLPPYFLDTTELTVAQLRASGLAGAEDPMRYSTQDGGGPPLRCTFTNEPGNFEDLPVNCISWTKAREVCAAAGGDLPTEAQHELAASALEGRLFPWGDDEPTCPDAVYSRSRFGANPDQLCPGAWVMPPGSGARDRVERPDGVIVDLGGNLSELVLDRWNLRTESCWGTGVAFDPLCDQPSNDPNADGQHTVMGGSFVTLAASLAASFRAPALSFARAKSAGPSGGVYSPLVTSVGFRCARSAAP